MSRVAHLKAVLENANCVQQIEFLLKTGTNYSDHVWSLLDSIAANGESVDDIENYNFHPITENGVPGFAVVPKDPALKKVVKELLRQKWADEMKDFFEQILSIPNGVEKATETFNNLKGYYPELNAFKSVALVFNELYVENGYIAPEEHQLKKAGINVRKHKSCIRQCRKLFKA